jgi:alpha-methylacyl-CoA racemase
MTGPLTGVKIIEIAGFGAAPYGCILLAPAGDDVVHIRRESHAGKKHSLLIRNRQTISVDLKRAASGPRAALS